MDMLQEDVVAWAVVAGAWAMYRGWMFRALPSHAGMAGMILDLTNALLFPFLARWAVSTRLRACIHVTYHAVCVLGVLRHTHNRHFDLKLWSYVLLALVAVVTHFVLLGALASGDVGDDASASIDAAAASSLPAASSVAADLDVDDDDDAADFEDGVGVEDGSLNMTTATNATLANNNTLGGAVLPANTTLARYLLGDFALPLVANSGHAAVQELSLLLGGVMTANVFWVLFNMTQLLPFLIIAVCDAYTYLIAQARHTGSIPLLLFLHPVTSTADPEALFTQTLLNIKLLSPWLQYWLIGVLWLAFVCNSLYTIPRAPLLLHLAFAQGGEGGQGEKKSN